MMSVTLKSGILNGSVSYISDLPLHVYYKSWDIIANVPGPGLSGHLIGGDLYKYLTLYLTKHLKVLNSAAKVQTDEVLLPFYVREWNKYTTAAMQVNRIFRYLNKYWIQRQRDEEKKDIYTVDILYLARWKMDFIPDLKERIISLILLFIEKQRNGQIVEISQVKATLDSLVSLGDVEHFDSNTSPLAFYRSTFEKPYLDMTADYYR